VSRLCVDEGQLEVREETDGFYVRYQCRDSGLWRELHASWRQTWPHWSGVQFDRDRRAWRVPLHQRERLTRWADAWFAGEAQSWTTDAAGATGTDTHRREHSRLTSPVAGAYDRLFLQPSAPLWAAETVYRAALKRDHPDSGGSHVAAVAITSAMALIRDACAERSGVA